MRLSPSIPMRLGAFYFRKLLGIIPFLFLWVAVSFAGEEDPFEFSLEPNVSLFQENYLATITFRVPEGYMIYRESLKFNAPNAKLTFQLPIAHEKIDPFEGKKVEVFDAGTHNVQLFFEASSTPGVVQVILNYQGCSSLTCFMPATKELKINFGKTISIKPSEENLQDSIPSTFASSSTDSPSLTPIQKQISNPDDFGEILKNRGLVWALLAAFIGGLLVSFTPCVYPMIPITLSIIGSRGEGHSMQRGFFLSLIYVAGISFTYSILGLLVALSGAHVRGIIQGTFFQLVLAGFFVVLALSLFDLFVLPVPSGLQQKLTEFTKKTGLFNIFMIGAISGLAASPCVAAPLAGILAFIAASGSMLYGSLMLLSFAWGMSVLLIVVGTFSGAVNSLPRAGEWMNRVKEIYGFILLGMALYFAYPAIGPAFGSLFLAMLLFAFSAFLGLFQTSSPEDSLWKRVLKCWGILVIVFGIIEVVNSAVHFGLISLPKFAQQENQESDIKWHPTLESGRSSAALTHRPILVDFRADWCALCKEMEREVFPDPRVSSLLSKMTLVRIDATRNEESVLKILSQFKVVGLPTFLFLDQNGTERPGLRISGKLDALEFAARLVKALKE